jgi:hypothetical protein
MSAFLKSCAIEAASRPGRTCRSARRIASRATATSAEARRMRRNNTYASAKSASPVTVTKASPL